ncbi:MAG TPA: hypothetical protein VES02_00775 [Dermatophilaceae bacterium]|nr:hypothetical protein [Dermatophilaceae bacterium]
MSSASVSLRSAEHAQVRVRAQRHATSLPLIVVGLGLLVIAWLVLQFSSWILYPPVLAVGILLLLYITMWAQRIATGLGSGRDGYGLVLVVAVGVVFIPMSQLLGPAFSLGLGLVILGWRGREPLLWGSGVIVAAISPFPVHGTIGNYVHFLGSAPDTVVVAAAGAVLIAMGVRHFIRERRTTQMEEGE